MRIILLHRPNSETSRKIDEYLRDLNRTHPDTSIDVYDIDSIAGTSLASSYGIMIHPTILATDDSGRVQQLWQGVDKFPLMNDLAYYSQR